MNYLKKPATRETGFTMIELLIVISILVVMISIMAVAAGPVMNMVQRSSCSAQLKALAQVYLNYTNQYSIQFPSLNGSDTSKGAPPNPVSPTCGFDNLIYNGSYGYSVGFGPLSWPISNQQLIAASYYVCPGIPDRDQWWHEGTGSGDDYWKVNSNSNPDTSIQVNANNKPVGGPTSGTQIISSYSIRPGLYGWTPSQVIMQHGKSNMPAFRAFIADSFYVDATQLCVTTRHKDGVNVAYLDGSVKFCNFPFLTNQSNQPTSTVGSNLDNMWADFDLN